MQELKIRQYHDLDLKQVWELHIAGLRSAGVFREMSKELDKDFDDIEGTYLKGGEFLVGLLEDRIVSMGALRRISDERGEIKRLRTYPKHQQSGFGGEIYAMLEEKARKLQFKVLQADTDIGNTLMQRLLPEAGYREIERKKLGGMDSIIYEKFLL